MARQFHNTTVLPEIKSLEVMLALGIQDPVRLRNVIVSDQQFAQYVEDSNIEEHADRITDVLLSGGPYAACLAIAEVVHGEPPNPGNRLIIKMGASVFSWRELHKALPSSSLIYVHRHPCAVANSQLRTKRAYSEKGDMGRSDPWHCARVWNLHTGSAIALGDAATLVKFEDIIGGTALDQIAGQLGFDIRADPAGQGLKIADQESQLHQLVTKDPLDSRVDGWRSELPPHTQRVVAYLARYNMRLLGYEPEPSPSSLEMAKAGVVHSNRLATHQLSRVPLLLSQPRRVADHLRLRSRRYRTGRS